MTKLLGNKETQIIFGLVNFQTTHVYMKKEFLIIHLLLQPVLKVYSASWGT